MNCAWCGREAETLSATAMGEFCDICRAAYERGDINPGPEPDADDWADIEAPDLDAEAAVAEARRQERLTEWARRYYETEGRSDGGEDDR